MAFKTIFISLIFLFIPVFVFSQIADTDGDGLSDTEEQTLYYTNMYNSDTDADGFLDGEEILAHFSPHAAAKSLSQTDYDMDELSDWQELQFHTDINRADTDGDGWSDFDEITSGYNPLNHEPEKLAKKITIDLSDQILTATLAGIPLAAWPVSTGKPGYATPTGNYQINNKVERAWSKTYGLWMPYWMSFIGYQYGIHELPEWPGGIKEGVNHLGIPVSHGCVRLGIGPAAWLYNWAEIGTQVYVQP